MALLERLSKNERAIFEEIIECPKCLRQENLCESHSNSIREILVKDTKKMIDKLENSD